MTDGIPESVAKWLQIRHLEELRDKISNDEKTPVATWNEIIVGFIAFTQGDYLSLLLFRSEFSGKGIGRELFA